eukprot:s1204_g6.t1
MQRAKSEGSYQWQHASEILSGAGSASLQLGSFAFNSMVASAGRERLWQLALSLQQEMLFRNLRLDVYSYASAFNAVRGEDTAVELCSTIMTDMLSKHVVPNTVVLNAAIIAVSALAWEEALAYYAMMEDFSLEPDLITLSSAMSACTSGSAWRLAIQLFGQAEMQPNVVTSNAAISACSAGNLWQEALAVLSHMQEADHISYVGAISACRSQRQWQLALDLLQNCPGNVIACSAAIAVLEADGRWQFAVALLDKMRRRGPSPNVVTYNSVISACGKGQQWQRAIDFLAEARTMKLRPGTVALNAATSACEKGRRWQHAEQLLRDAQAAKLRIDAIGFSAATSACEKGWQWNHALQMLKEMHRRRLLEVLSCNAALSACGQCSETTAAMKLFRSMQKEQFHPNQVSYNAAIFACSQGYWQEAVQLLGEMKAAELAPDLTTYNSATGACGRANELSTALKLLKEAECSQQTPDVLSFLALVPAIGSGDTTQLRSLAAALDRAEAATVLPEASNLENALGPSLALAEALAAEEHLRQGWLQLRLLYNQAYTQLSNLIHSCQPPGKQLRDPVLERQNSLGAFFTDLALAEMECWVDFPQVHCRRELQQIGLASYGTEPLAQHLPAWAAATFSSSSLTFGTGDADGALSAVYVDHSRASHAERQVLLAVIRAATVLQLLYCERGELLTGTELPLCSFMIMLDRFNGSRAPGVLRKLFGLIARLMAVLCLPELVRYPPPDEEVQCRAKLLTAVDEVSRVALGRGCRAETSVSRSRRGVNAGSSRASLEDFLESPRRSGRPGRVRSVRPTQRQPIDDNTSVPADVHQSMLQLADEARARSTHRRAFAQGTGEPYLEHTDAASLRQMRAAEEARSKSPVAQEAPTTWRRSSCATEVIERAWCTSESPSVVVPVQVI